MVAPSIVLTTAIDSLPWSTPTTTGPIHLETVTRSIDSHRDSIQVHRDYGTLVYTPVNPNMTPDDIVYDEQGRVITPIDEFNVPYGAAFCGQESDLPLPGIGSEAFPYNTCADVDAVTGAFALFFGIFDVEKPLPESASTSRRSR